MRQLYKRQKVVDFSQILNINAEHRTQFEKEIVAKKRRIIIENALNNKSTN